MILILLISAINAIDYLEVPPSSENSGPPVTSDISGSDDNECNCFIESFLAAYGVPLEKLQTIAIGVGTGIIAMFITIVGLSIGICCLKSKYKRKKERVYNMSDSLEREKRYAEFLEFQKRSNQPPPLPIVTPSPLNTPHQPQVPQLYQITPSPAPR